MDNLRATYKDEEEEEECWSDALDNIPPSSPSAAAAAAAALSPLQDDSSAPPRPQNPSEQAALPQAVEAEAEDEDEGEEVDGLGLGRGNEEVDDDEENKQQKQEKREKTRDDHPQASPIPSSSETLPATTPIPDPSSNDDDYEDEDDDDDLDGAPRKKQKPLACFTSTPTSDLAAATTADETPSMIASSTGVGSANGNGAAAKKPKKKSNNVWTKSTSRKGKKKGKSGGNNHNHNAAPEDNVLITPIPRFPDKSDDSPDAFICLSRVYKAERVELSEDRLTAGSTKGYRMVRATRGVVEGAWYFEVTVVHLGETGHTRLGWTMEKGDLQAPVGYNSHSFGYRDIDGAKVHKALREKYGEEGYAQGDVIGFYINLPEGAGYAPKPPHLVWFKGQRYMYSADGKDEPPKVVPGSEISYFKNGICQGIAFRELFGGRYYPAASMYTLPNQPNCEVRFNFGPNFQFFPEVFGDRPIPRPMVEVSYHGYDGRVEDPAENGHSEKTN